MHVKRKKAFIHIIKWFLPLLFILFINGKALFTHAHVIDDIVVVHTHPFKKSEKSTHNHTTKELIAIEFHTDGHSTDVVIENVEINSPLSIVDEHKFTRKDNFFSSKENNNVLLRAPPFISYI